MRNLRIALYLFSILIPLLSACGSPPKLIASTAISQNFEKVRSLQFVYKNVYMESSTVVLRKASMGDTGFYLFGELLAREAPIIFARNGIAAIDSRYVRIDQSWSLDSAPQGAGGEPLPVLIVYPINGNENSNGRATSVSYVFSSELVDPKSKRVLWQGKIDTSTWNGDDFVTGHFKKTLYDKEYADQFLQALIVQLKEDHVVE